MFPMVCFINYRWCYIIYSLCNLVQSSTLLALCDPKQFFVIFFISLWQFLGHIILSLPLHVVRFSTIRLAYKVPPFQGYIQAHISVNNVMLHFTASGCAPNSNLKKS